MQKQYAGNDLGASEATSAGSDPAGQEVQGDRAWSSTGLSSDLSAGGTEVATGANPALSGGAFVFEPSWLGEATAVASLSGGLLPTYLVDGLEHGFAALSGQAADGVVHAVAETIPVWSLSHDDFSHI